MFFSFLGVGKTKGRALEDAPLCSASPRPSPPRPSSLSHNPPRLARPRRASGMSGFWIRQVLHEGSTAAVCCQRTHVCPQLTWEEPVECNTQITQGFRLASSRGHTKKENPPARPLWGAIVFKQLFNRAATFWSAIRSAVLTRELGKPGPPCLDRGGCFCY